MNENTILFASVLYQYVEREGVLIVKTSIHIWNTLNPVCWVLYTWTRSQFGSGKPFAPGAGAELCKIRRVRINVSTELCVPDGLCLLLTFSFLVHRESQHTRCNHPSLKVDRWVGEGVDEHFKFFEIADRLFYYDADEITFIDPPHGGI